MQKLGMKPVPGVMRVQIRKSKNVSKGLAALTEGMWVQASRCWSHCAHGVLNPWPASSMLRFNILGQFNE
jgi:hypothetical protein